MAKPEIQSTTFASRRNVVGRRRQCRLTMLARVSRASVTQRDIVRVFSHFYTFIKVEYQQNSNVINDVFCVMNCL